LPMRVASYVFIAIGVVMVFTAIRGWVLDSRRDSPYLGHH